MFARKRCWSTFATTSGERRRAVRSYWTRQVGLFCDLCAYIAPNNMHHSPVDMRHSQTRAHGRRVRFQLNKHSSALDRAQTVYIVLESQRTLEHNPLDNFVSPPPITTKSFTNPHCPQSQLDDHNLIFLCHKRVRSSELHIQLHVLTI